MAGIATTETWKASPVWSLDDIAANAYNLNISRYVQPNNEQEVLTVEEAMHRCRERAAAAFASEARLIRILEKEGLICP